MGSNQAINLSDQMGLAQNLKLRVTPLIENIDGALQRGTEPAYVSNMQNRLTEELGEKAGPVVAIMLTNAPISGTVQYDPRKRYDLYHTAAEASPVGSSDRTYLARTAEDIRISHPEFFQTPSKHQQHLNAMLARLQAQIG